MKKIKKLIILIIALALQKCQLLNLISIPMVKSPLEVPLNKYNFSIIRQCFISTKTSYFCAFIRFDTTYSAASTPDYTFFKDSTTGIFHPASDVIGFTTGGTERSWYTSSGYVGIGTNSPSNLLHVYYSSGSAKGILVDGSSNPVFQMANSGTIRGTIGLATAATDFSLDAVANDIVFRVESTSQHLIFNNGAGHSTMCLYNGAVDIGTTVATPSDSIKLFTIGSGMFSTATSGTGSTAFIHAAKGYSGITTPDYTWWYDLTTGMYHPTADQIGFTTGGNEDMLIGTNSINFYAMQHDSSYPAVVNSYVYETTATTWNAIYHHGTGNAFNFYVYGNGAEWAKSNNILSDVRLKQNISTIQNSLAKVMQLRGVTYKFIPQDSTDFYKKTRMGLIAQEVQKVVPEVVSMGKDSLLGIEYANMVGLLVEAIKAQNHRIDSLRDALAECCIKNHERTQKSDSGVGSNNPNNTQNVTLSSVNSAILYQNTPNPFSTGTKINYFLPEGTQGASMLFFDMYGNKIKEVPLQSSSGEQATGMGTLNITPDNLKDGVYSYSLVISGQVIDTKKMVLQK